MSTIHLHQTTTATPEQFVAGLTDFGPGRSKLFGNSADEYLKVHDQGPIRPTSRRARAASGNACTTTGPIPTTSSSRPPTPTCGEATRATPTPSRGSPTGRPTWTSSWCARARTSRDGCSGSCSGPSARASSERRFENSVKAIEARNDGSERRTQTLVDASSLSTDDHVDRAAVPDDRRTADPVRRQRRLAGAGGAADESLAGERVRVRADVGHARRARPPVRRRPAGVRRIRTPRRSPLAASDGRVPGPAHRRGRSGHAAHRRAGRRDLGRPVRGGGASGADRERDRRHRRSRGSAPAR